jgi:DNA-binding response OmpR family regulator
MTTHFSSVPVDWAHRAAHSAVQNRIRPLALVIEDDPVLGTTIAAILNGNGIAALIAGDSFSALETALVIPPQIVIADFGLPGINGLDLVCEITGAVPDCDAILFAGQFSSGLAARMGAPGSRLNVLHKPVHPADLLNSVFDILGRRGHPLALPKLLRRRPSLYDLASSNHREEDSLFGTCIVSHRRRRPARLIANPV